MTIEEFLKLTAGQWFTQRTSYLLTDEQVENSKAEITTELLNADHPEVIQLCQKSNFSGDQSLGAIKSTWNNSVDWGKPKVEGSSLLVFIPDGEQINQGQVLRYLSSNPSSTSIANYSFQEDGVLTLSLQQEDLQLEERQWFASDNLKLRNTVVNQGQKCTQTAFYSEIRRLITPKQ